MATVRVRPGAHGSVSYAVLWRDRDTNRQTSMTFPTEQEAENFRRILDGASGNLDRATDVIDAIQRKVPTVREMVAQHIDGLSGVTARTRADYRRDALRYITPHLGHHPVDRLTAAHVRAWLNVMAAATSAGRSELLSDKTISNCHGLLSSAMTTAIREGLRTENPCSGARLPRRDHDATEMVCLSRDEWAVLDGELGRVLGGHHRLLFRTLAGTGMRWGEAAALTVGDLMLEADPPMLRISRAQRRDDQSRAYVGPTKTRRSKRTISLPPTLAGELRGHVRGKPADALVFTSRMGNRLNHSNVRIFAWLAAIKAAQDREVYGARALTQTPRIHDLRHSHASWLIQAGVDIFAVSRRLGHEQVATTTGVYAHLMPEQQRSTAAATEAILH